LEVSPFPVEYHLTVITYDLHYAFMSGLLLFT
jgi:hypothetical protein